MTRQRVGLVALVLVAVVITALWQERTRLCDDALSRRAHPRDVDYQLAQRDVPRYCLTWLGLP